MRQWWQGTRLVFERSLREQLRSKAFRTVTGLLLVASAALVFLPGIFTDRSTSYTLATVGRPPADLVATLDAAGGSGGFDVTYVTRGTDDQVREAVRDGEATVGVAGGRLYVGARETGPFPSVVSQSVVALETTRRLARAGLSPEQIAQIRSTPPPEHVAVAPVQDQGRAAVGYGVGIVLYLALMGGGQIIAMAVATEKSTRISEVLLAILRPSQVLVGTVLAVGTVMLLQLLVLAAPAAVASRVTDNLVLPSMATGDIVLGVVWFVLGFALYAFLYAAAGALVDKVTEAGAATMPLTMLLLLGYMINILVMTSGPGSPAGVAASMFPITAPLTMPVRWSSGEVPGWQLALAMALTAAAALGMIVLASRIYRRALLVTGHRARIREVLAA